MNNFSGSKYLNHDKIEAIKNKLNASNIIKQDFLNQPNQSRYEPRVISSNYMQTKQSTPLQGNYQYEDLKEKVQREINNRVNLQTEKKELELMIEDQVEAQDKLKEEYSRHIETTKNQIEYLNQMIEDLQKEIENKREKLSKVEDENNETEADINEILDENGLLEQEIEKLGNKTGSKMTQMQQKMQGGLQELEILKEKHDDELKKIHDFQTEKIKRIEDDYKKKMNDLNDKYNSQLLSKQDAESELLRLQDGKRRAELELENKIKAIKEQYYDDEYNKFRGVLKIYENRLRNAVDNKENYIKKNEQLEKEIVMLEEDLQEHENQLQEENKMLGDNVVSLKEDLNAIKSQLDSQRNDNFNINSQIQKLQSEIQKNKYNFKQISENGKYKIKDTIEKNKFELENVQNRIQHQQGKVMDLEQQVKMVRQEYQNAEKQNQRLLGNMKNQLNKNIFQTINEYKDINTSRVNDPRQSRLGMKEKSFQNSFYPNQFQFNYLIIFQIVFHLQYFCSDINYWTNIMVMVFVHVVFHMVRYNRVELGQ